MVNDRDLIGVDCFVISSALVKGVVRAVNGRSNRLDGGSVIEREIDLGT